MITSRLVAICGALLVSLTSGSLLVPTAPTHAQSREDQIRGDAARRQQVDNLLWANRRERAQHGLSPEDVVTAARTQIALTDTACEVTDAKFLGETPDKTSLYEVACADGPGYIIQSKTPPSVTDCIILAASAQALRAQDPTAEVGSQCELPGNTDILGAIKSYAQHADVDCIVDQGKVLGADGDTVIYEVGCQGTQGFWIRKTGPDWSKTACIQVVAENAACEFTTPAEIATSAKALLAGTDAAACDVTQARLMGQNPTGMYYEVKCATEGEGFIARVQNSVTNRVYPCATAQQIGGGCILTQAPATPAPESE
ncbi:hypothetical protein U0030_09930 [Brevundimonas bullata]|uniref:hypothetical protein n=1 Tax=Brevundimonas bullata TaxID=13160 RepID=UPI001FE78F69|nr:hypothetical protein [Brevundimonas bullata]WQE35614.1 hypothetical protein U0030_09930 [Brevundimonas bullata]